MTKRSQLVAWIKKQPGWFYLSDVPHESFGMSKQTCHNALADMVRLCLIDKRVVGKNQYCAITNATRIIPAGTAIDEPPYPGMPPPISVIEHEKSMQPVYSARAVRGAFQHGRDHMASLLVSHLEKTARETDDQGRLGKAFWCRQMIDLVRDFK